MANHGFIDLEAGKTFEKVAQIQTQKLNEPDDAANAYIDAFKAYRKVDAQAAVRCAKVAIDRYCAKGNFRRAASQQEQVGEVYEMELKDAKGALEAYEAAATWYEGDGANAYVILPNLEGTQILIGKKQPRQQAVAQGRRHCSP